MNKQRWINIVALNLVVMISFMGVCVANKPLMNDNRMCKSIIVQQKGEQIKTGFNAWVSSSEILIPVEAVKKYINSDAQFDREDNRVYVYFEHPDFKLETAKLDKKIADGITLNFLSKSINGAYYLNVMGLEKVFGVVLQQNGEGVLVIEKKASQDKKLSDVRNKWTPTNKLNLVWEYVNTDSPDLAKEEQLEGLGIIAPTWFSIANGSGFVTSKADAKYVADAHQKGYKVWALLNNSFDKELTHQLLADVEAQDKVIKQMLVYSSLYNLDGINVDIENVYDEDRDRLTDFMARLTGSLKEQNSIVSIDVTVPANISFWSKCYDRKKLASIVDYMMVMTYDEHWSTSAVSGPVASIKWVEAGVKKMLTEVPKEKLLLGLPFYTREWEEQTKTDGTVKVKAKTMSMEAVEDKIREKGLSFDWLEDKGQNYTEYHVGDKRYRIWIEDEKSIGLKVSLVDKYNLAGVASWRKGFERKSIWHVLSTALTMN